MCTDYLFFQRLPGGDDTVHRVIFRGKGRRGFIDNIPRRVGRLYAFHLGAVRSQQLLRLRVGHDDERIRPVDDNLRVNVHEQAAVPLFGLLNLPSTLEMLESRLYG